MLKLHKKAARLIFQERNSGITPKVLNSTRQSNIVLDFHGLHPQEAVKYLEIFLGISNSDKDFMDELGEDEDESDNEDKGDDKGDGDSDSNEIGKSFSTITLFQHIPSTIQIIVGTGHHSIRQRSKLLPTIKEFLNSNKYKYNETSKEDKLGGILTIHTKK